MKKTIAIDGACRRNGQSDCIAAGACFILDEDIVNNESVIQCNIASNYEEGSTSQRGELLGLLLALEHIYKTNAETVIVTDSEYLFNTMIKERVDRWQHNGWKTAQGDDVKNRDIWAEIWQLYTPIKELVTFYHTKGHLLSIGVKKYHELMRSDNTGYMLYNKALTSKSIDPAKLQHAKELSVANNGFELQDDVIQQFAAMNLVADAVANLCIEVAEARQWQLMLNNHVPTE